MIALKKAYAWVVVHWRWLLLPVGVLLWLLGRGSKQTKVVVASPELTAHEEVDRQLEARAAAKVQAAGVKRDDDLATAETQRTAALQATEEGARQQAVDLQNDPTRVTGFLEQVGRDVRRG